ncbi:MAG: LON peptidase substrate-binding domain-containing protein [Candidatus Limnocylindria bacterium]
MRLPFFPLHVVAFPHLPLPVHIFEERYRAMTRDLLAAESPYQGRFAVSMIVDGQEADADPAARAVGTICEVRTAEELPDGRWVMLAVGVTRATLTGIDHARSYATIEALPLPELSGPDAAVLLPRAQAALDEYMQTVKQFVASAASVGKRSQEISSVAASLDEVLKPIRLPDDPLAASYAVGGVLQIELTRKQALLELPDAATRLRAEIDLLRSESRFLSEGALPPVISSDLSYNPN